MPLLRNLKTNEALEIIRKKVVIGRHSSDDMTINDPKCSRGNTEIEFVDGKYFVRDRGSRNGTSLNGALLKEATPLNYGDKILIGTTELEFQRTPEKINIEITGYEILEHIASGGMGKVYKARQMSLDRIVAIKVLAPKFTNNPRLTENFINEARAVGRLNHPNLVQVHDVNKDFQRNGQVIYYFTMEFVNGKTLKEMIRDLEKIPALQTVELLIEITRGLEYIHSNNLIHRDIKPDNIMIDSEGNIKIADLGIAVDTNEAEIVDPTLEEGQKRIVGTPHYIAPEQIRGKDIDARTDIYSLGATAFHMLTGETPFEGGSSKEIIKKHLSEEPRDIHEFSPDTPQAVIDVIKKMMSKKQEERPQSAQALRELLEQVKAKLEKGRTRTRVAKKKLTATNYIMYVVATFIGLFIAAIYFYFTEIHNGKPIAVTTPQSIDESPDSQIQSQMQQAEEFTKKHNYLKALEIYENIKKEYPEHQIIPETEALIKKINTEMAKAQQSQKADEATAKFNEIMNTKAQNPRENQKIIALLEEYKKKYPDSKEISAVQAEIQKQQMEISKTTEITQLEEFKRQYESISTDENKLIKIQNNKKSFRQKESIQWFNEKEKELKQKLEEIVASATKDAQALDQYINNDDYVTAMERANKFSEDFTYSKAKDIIIAKIAVIEKKADVLKENTIKECQEDLNNLFYTEIIINKEGRLNKLKGTKAYESLRQFLEDVKTCQKLYTEIDEMLKKQAPIPLSYTEVEGAFDVQYSVQSLEKKAIVFVFQKAAGQESQIRTIAWNKFDKTKLYLVYDSVVKANNKSAEYSQALKAFQRTHHVTEKDLNSKNK